MDTWNPILAETEIKEASVWEGIVIVVVGVLLESDFPWKAVIAFILSIPLLLVVMWLVTVFLFSLEVSQ